MLSPQRARTSRSSESPQPLGVSAGSCKIHAPRRRPVMTRLPIRENVELDAFTTLGVGGKARFFLDIADEATLRAALEWASQSGSAVTVLGGGGNVLGSDRGFDGLGLRLRVHRGGAVHENSGDSRALSLW